MDASAATAMIAVPPGQVTLSGERSAAGRSRSRRTGSRPCRSPRHGTHRSPASGRAPRGATGCPSRGSRGWTRSGSASRCPDARAWRPRIASTPPPRVSSGTRVPVADRGRVGVRLPRRDDWAAVRAARRHRLASGQLARAGPRRGRQAAQRVGPARHAGQRVGVVLRVYDAEVYGTYRVLRGGAWFDERWSCRASVRRRSHPTFQIDDVGFRVARSIPR
jgi:sulfatase-modifying factor enzyme 1